MPTQQSGNPSNWSEVSGEINRAIESLRQAKSSAQRGQSAAATDTLQELSDETAPVLLSSTLSVYSQQSGQQADDATFMGSIDQLISSLESAQQHIQRQEWDQAVSTMRTVPGAFVELAQTSQTVSRKTSSV